MKWRIKKRLQFLSFPLILTVLGFAWKFAIHRDKQLRENLASTEITNQPRELILAVDESRDKKQPKI